jgi:signal transduction histidine kinase
VVASVIGHPGLVGRLRTALPQGRLLPEQAWNARHRGIVALLWTLVPALALFGILRGKGVTHSALETLPLVSLAITACLTRLSRRARGCAASFGLLTFSAVFVHLWDGRTEAHFAFFVVVALLMLYQDWLVFLLAIGFVVVHHSVLGFVDPASVFDHAHDGRPLQWGLIHGAFVLAASAANMVSWRANEQLLHQRDRQEVEAQLAHSRRLESVGQLAGGVAHDFNNLLAVIVNCASLARDELPGGHAAGSELASIEDAAERGARLVRQLLLFSQSKAGDPELLDVNGVVRAMDGLLGHTLGRHIALRYELGAKPALVVADLSSFEQVLVNLVVNARDAFVAGGTITVRTANVKVDLDAGVELEIPAGRYVRMSVADDGCGMDADTLARACEPFFTTKGPGRGTGLGLATVFGVARQAGGCVTFDSRPGTGTTVHIHLPSAPAATDTTPRAQPELATTR